VWYVYAQCPTCRCIPKISNPNEPVLSAHERSEKRREREMKRQEVLKSETRAALQQEEEAKRAFESDGGEEQSLSFSDFVEDYGRYLFAAIVTIIFAGVIFAQVSFSILPRQETTSSTKKTVIVPPNANSEGTS